MCGDPDRFFVINHKGEAQRLTSGTLALRQGFDKKLFSCRRIKKSQKQWPVETHTGSSSGRDRKDNPFVSGFCQQHFLYSQLSEQVCQVPAVKTSLCSPYQPQTDAWVERMNPVILAAFPLSGTVQFNTVFLRVVPLDLTCVSTANNTLTWWAGLMPDAYM